MGDRKIIVVLFGLMLILVITEREILIVHGLAMNQRDYLINFQLVFVCLWFFVFVFSST